MKQHKYLEAVVVYEEALQAAPDKLWIYLKIFQSMEKANRVQAYDPQFSAADFKQKLVSLRIKIRTSERQEDYLLSNESTSDRDFYRQ